MIAVAGSVIHLYLLLTPQFKKRCKCHYGIYIHLSGVAHLRNNGKSLRKHFCCQKLSICVGSDTEAPLWEVGQHLGPYGAAYKPLVVRACSVLGPLAAQAARDVIFFWFGSSNIATQEQQGRAPVVHSEPRHVGHPSKNYIRGRAGLGLDKTG